MGQTNSPTLNNGRLGFSNSEIQLFLRCPRRWLTEYYWGFLPANPSPLGAANLGTRVHLALEAKFGYGLDPGTVLDILYGAEVANHPDLARELNADLEMSKIMVEGLLEWMDAEGHSSKFRYVAAEAEVRVPLPGFDGIDLRAKLDQIGQWTDTGLYAFLDWKTRDVLQPLVLLRMDPQMRFYSLVQWLAAGYPPPQPGRGLPDTAGMPPLVLGGNVAQLRKVKRSRQAKPPFYQWDPFSHTPEIMASTLIKVQATVAKILAARAALDDCYARGGNLAEIDFLQKSMLGPVWISHDCSWSCPLAKGACGMMDDGSAWVEHFVGSGAYVQGDPYERYSSQSIAALVSAAG